MKTVARIASTVAFLLLATHLVGVGVAAADQHDKRVLDGAGKWSFGRIDLSLDPGASAEVRYQPDVSRLELTVLTGAARIVVSARYLVLIENLEGDLEIRLASGRVVNVEPGRTEIVGQALVDDPGQIVVLSGLRAVVTVLDDSPAARLAGIVTQFGGEFHGDSGTRPVDPRPEGDSEETVSPTQLRRFGARF